MNSITVTAHHGFILRLLWRHVWWRPTFPYTRSALADGHWWPCPRFLKRNQLWLLWWPGWWFGTFGLFFHILGRIIPTEFHIFQRGRRKTFQPDHVWSVFFPFMNLKKIAPKNIRSKVKHAADPGASHAWEIPTSLRPATRRSGWSPNGSGWLGIYRVN